MGDGFHFEQHNLFLPYAPKRLKIPSIFQTERKHKEFTHKNEFVLLLQQLRGQFWCLTMILQIAPILNAEYYFRILTKL
jgi:hypothetical protein